ncbi:MAG TPA: hypothetical protein VMS76_20035, partial [Planctomycetota bacterium]|nr:hypothetical protein [Planctomycetota bacterium]
GFVDWKLEVAETSGQPAGEAETEAILARLERAVAALQARGARVAAFFLPACGRRAEIEERRWPRARYWDRFAASSSATVIHAGDEPDFPRFDCYDGSHLDDDDVPEFTRALARVVMRRLGERP